MGADDDDDESIVSPLRAGDTINSLILGTQRSTKNNHVDIHFNSQSKIYENYTENHPRRTFMILIHKSELKALIFDICKEITYSYILK